MELHLYRHKIQRCHKHNYYIMVSEVINHVVHSGPTVALFVFYSPFGAAGGLWFVISRFLDFLHDYMLFRQTFMADQA